jgi:hypothetical protein
MSIELFDRDDISEDLVFKIHDYFNWNDDVFDLGFLVLYLKEHILPAYYILMNILQMKMCGDCKILTPYYPHFNYQIIHGQKLIQCKRCACPCVTKIDYPWGRCAHCGRWHCQKCSHRCLTLNIESLYSEDGRFML